MPTTTDDGRPFGWGICHLCGVDCDDEADYDELRRVSLCPACRERELRRAYNEQQAEEVYTRR